MALATSAITTSGAMPSPSAAANTANLAVNPLVSGMPARASSRNVITPGDQRRALGQPGPLRQVGGLAVGVAHQADHPEHGERGEAVGQQVEQRARRRPASVIGHRAEQQEAGVRHRRVGDHPLDVGLGEADHRADRPSRRSRWPTARPRHSQRVSPNATCSTRRMRAERRDLGAGRHERGDRRRRALVDVRRPGVERADRALEQQARRPAARARRAAARPTARSPPAAVGDVA